MKYRFLSSAVNSNILNLNLGKNKPVSVTNLIFTDGNPFIIPNKPYELVETLIAILTQIPSNHVAHIIVKAVSAIHNLRPDTAALDNRFYINMSPSLQCTSEASYIEFLEILAANYLLNIENRYGDNVEIVEIQFDVYIEMNPRKVPVIAPISRKGYQPITSRTDVASLQPQPFDDFPLTDINKLNFVVPKLPIPLNFLYNKWFNHVQLNEITISAAINNLLKNSFLNDVSSTKPLFTLQNELLTYYIILGEQRVFSHDIYIFIMSGNNFLISAYKDTLPFSYSTTYEYSNEVSQLSMHFTRVDLGSKINFIINSQTQSIILWNRPVKTSFVKKASPSNFGIIKRNYSTQPSLNVNIDNKPLIKLMVFDIETYFSIDQVGDEIAIPYACGIYHKGLDKPLTFYKISSETNVIRLMLNEIMQPKFHGYTVYAHNLSKFDANFIMDELQAMVKYPLKIIVNNDNVLVILDASSEGVPQKTSRRGPNRKTSVKFTLHFRDSYLLLRQGLGQLGKTFEVPVQKGSIDHNSINQHNYLDYKTEVLEYLDKDLLSLHQILEKYFWFNHDRFKVSMFESSTISALSWDTFTTHFYDDSRPIPVLKNEVYDFIRLGYFGGRVEFYKTYGENLYYYDVNSLYPFAMNKELPVYNPQAFSGEGIDIKSINGFCLVEIESPVYMDKPFLLYRSRKTGKLYAPLGKWTGVYYSEELKYAETLGYKIKVLGGYNFELGRPYSSYIEYFYNLKALTNDPTTRYISKLALNNLYGRTGIRPSLNLVETFNDEREFESLVTNENVSSWVTYKDDVMRGFALINQDPSRSQNSLLNVSTAAAVTGEARIHMYKFLSIPGNDAYYTDTDSVVLTKPLPEHLVNNELGGMKLEHIIKEGYMLAPKGYMFHLNNDTFTVKIKGINLSHYYSSIEDKTNLFKDLEKLNNGEISNISLNQDKMFRDNMFGGNIRLVRNSPYNFKVSEDKRKIIRDDKGRIIGTKPFTIQEINEMEK